MRAIYKNQSGFTIVELLIVIVVIAILAAITLVAYNGVQARAALSTDLSAVQSYMAGIEQLSIAGNLPTANACLGPSSTYTATTGNCPILGQSATQSDSTIMNTRLHGVGTKDVSFVESTGLTPMYVYGYSGVQDNFILYAIGTSQVCGISGVLSQQNGNGAWGYWGDPYTLRYNGLTFCIVKIPTSS